MLKGKKFDAFALSEEQAEMKKLQFYDPAKL